MKKETVEKFFTFLDKKEGTGMEAFSLGAASHWGEIERIKDSKNGTIQAFYQILEDDTRTSVKVTGDFDVNYLFELIDDMSWNWNWKEGAYGVWERIGRVEISGNADLSGEFSIRMPATLIVGGDLDIRNSEIYSLPRHHLEVGGDFYVGGSSLWRSKYDMNEFRLEADLKERGFKIKGDIIYTEPGPLYSTFTL